MNLINAPDDTRPSENASRVGWVFPGVVALLVAAFFVTTPMSLTQVEMGTDARPLLVVAAAVSTTAVVLAHRWPWAATAVALLPFLIVPWADSFVWGWLLGVLGVMVVAAVRSWRAGIPAWLAAAVIVGVYASGGYPAALPIGLVTSGGEHGFATAILAIYLGWHTAVLFVAATLGRTARDRLRRTEVATKERRAFEVESVVAERARMARDLHDVVAHHVSLIAVRAESAPYEHPTIDPASRVVLAAIADDARLAITELRHALTVLRRADDREYGAETSGRRPQPALDDLPGLLNQARDAGQRIDVDGAWPDVSAPQGYTLYRAVQEGLTNARRHAAGSTVTLTCDHSRRHIGFTMSNLAPHSDPASVPGRGLLGMQERVAALGGTVETGTVDERFLLRVELPRQERP